MMKNCIESTSADSLSGAIFALEGIQDSCVVLNGPTGCKFYHSTISDKQYPWRTPSQEALPLESKLLGGSGRVPCTYLDGYDYVYGCGNKLTDLLRILAKGNYKLLAIVNSPGAALIGDDLEKFLQQEIKIPCFAVENTGFSGQFADGYQNAWLKAFTVLPLAPRKIRPKTVNLLGFCLYQKYYEGNVQELKRLLALCGIEVISAPGAGDKVATVCQLTEAEYNVVVYPEYGLKLAEKLQATHQMPYLVPEEGVPVGFAATESFVRQVCQAVGANPEPALEDLAKTRARAYLLLSRFSSLLGLPKGSLFSVRGESSLAYPLTKWLCTYLGMIPAAVNTSQEAAEFKDKLEGFLGQIHYQGVLANPVYQTETQLAFADGTTIAQLRLQGRFVSGIEIALPTLGYLDFVEKTILGANGALFLLEQTVNGLRYLRVQEN
ncbi:MAG: nitrogenase component 1 [Clostridia bacterium]|nr:nitrogenase component 1 [Clostridia bacterium]